MPPAKKTAAPRKPQDRRPKAKAIAAQAAGEDFTFEHDGETFALPNVTPYAASTPGGAFMDAILADDGTSEIRLAMLALKSASDDIDPDAYEALRAKPMDEFLEIIGNWMTHAQGASLGES
jgi:hypothetical protein